METNPNATIKDILVTAQQQDKPLSIKLDKLGPKAQIRPGCVDSENAIRSLGNR